MTADPENAAAPSEAVCVAVHVRPLIEQERDQMCGEVLDVTPGVPQVSQQAEVALTRLCKRPSDK